MATPPAAVVQLLDIGFQLFTPLSGLAVSRRRAWFMPKGWAQRGAFTVHAGIACAEYG